MNVLLEYLNIDIRKFYIVITIYKFISIYRYIVATLVGSEDVEACATIQRNQSNGKAEINSSLLLLLLSRYQC